MTSENLAVRGAGALLRRMLEQPDLALQVQRLEAPVLARVIESVGLEDAGELVALASAAQLTHIFDHELWVSESVGEDEHFDVRFALFAQTDAETRLRILEGRRTRLTERLENVRQSAVRTRERLDEYTLELQRHGLEQVEREVRWLDGLIDNERGTRRGTTEGDGRPAGPANADGAPAPQL